MTAVRLLTAVTGPGEAALAAGLEQQPQVQVVRRCADVADLLASADAGLAAVAVVSAEMRGLDADVVDRLSNCGCALVLLAEPADDAALRGLAAHPSVHILAAGSPAHDVARVALTAGEPARLGSSGRHRHGPDRAEGSEPDGGALTQRSTTDLGLGDPRGALPRPLARSAAQPGQSTPGQSTPGHLMPGRAAAGRVIAVWGPTGAPGRTMIAIALAAELAADDPTLLVDADTYGASIGQCLGLLDEAPGLAAAAHDADRGRLDLARLSRHAPLVLGELRVLTGVIRADRWPELRAGALATVLERARQLVTWIVVDTGFCLEQDEELVYDTAAPRRNGATLASLAAADVVVAVGGADPVGLQRLVRGVQDLKDVGHPPHVVVANRVRASAVGSGPGRRIREALQRYAGIDDPVMVPYDRESMDAALLVGRTLAEQGRSTPVRQAVGHVAARVRRTVSADDAAAGVEPGLSTVRG